MSKTLIYLIGIGDDGLEGLSYKTRNIMLSCSAIFGGERHILMLDGVFDNEKTSPTLHRWKSPLRDSLADIESALSPIVILASGDPMWHGIGKMIYDNFAADSITTIPAVGSFSLCCARLGWQMEDVATVSLHNRNISFLLRHLGRNRRTLILTRNASTLPEIANLLLSTPYKDVTLHIMEHLGGEKERISTLTPAEQVTSPLAVSDLYCIALEIPDHVGLTLPFGGIPDEQLFHDGVMTKSRIRSITIADLCPYKDALLWDIGAGCGSISIEWMYLGGKAIAIEQKPARLRLIQQNVEKFGLTDLVTIHGQAPSVCRDLPSPDAIFIGGGLGSDETLFDFCYERLRMNGRIVMNVVTLESEQVLLELYRRYGGMLSRIALSEAVEIGQSDLHGWKPSMPITHYVLEKQ